MQQQNGYGIQLLHQRYVRLLRIDNNYHVGKWQDRALALIKNHTITMTKKEIAQAEAVKTLKEWGVADGTHIYAKVTRVSASGMNRRVQLFITECPEGRIIDITYWAAKALEWGYKDGYNGGISVSGCGMDMLFHTVYSLSYAMGYGSLNQGHENVEKNNAGHYGLRYRSI